MPVTRHTILIKSEKAERSFLCENTLNSNQVMQQAILE